MFQKYKRDGRGVLDTSELKSKEYLKGISDQREKMKLKTKLEIYGTQQMTNEELKKLANWGFYRFNRR